MNLEISELDRVECGISLEEFALKHEEIENSFHQSNLLKFNDLMKKKLKN